MWALLPICFVAIILGFTAVEQTQVRSTSSNQLAVQSLAAGQRFLMYRNAVFGYVENNPGFTGTVQVAQLTLPAGVDAAALGADASNIVISDGTGGFDIYVYAEGTQAEVGQIAELMPGDMTIGYTSGNEFETPELGATSTVPNTIPSGDIVSVMQIGG